MTFSTRYADIIDIVYYCIFMSVHCCRKKRFAGFPNEYDDIIGFGVHRSDVRLPPALHIALDRYDDCDGENPAVFS